MPLRHAIRGFTLIELLVVVTIIVVLLALLVPAMDKAIRQAELLQCMTNQKVLAATSGIYAVENKRTYPFRDLKDTPQSDNLGTQAHKLASPLESGSGIGNYDIRLMLRPYLSINKTFNDPFVEAVDLDKADVTGGASQTTHVYASIFYWAGWKFRGHSAMSKLGDRFSAPSDHGTRRFSLLAGDIDCNAGTAYSSHPDDEGYLAFQRVQDAAFPFGGLITVAQWTRPANNDTRTPVAAYRSPLDLNFAYADGSVLAKRSVGWYHGEGMTRIPNLNTNSGGNNHVPKE